MDVTNNDLGGYPPNICWVHEMIMKQASLLLLVLFACVSCRTAPGTVHDLSMRFTHPELYEGRDDFARENALVQMRKLGLLKRGMTKPDIQALLGSPGNSKPIRWRYGLNASVLLITFDKTGRASSFTWHYDEGPHVDKPERW